MTNLVIMWGMAKKSLTQKIIDMWPTKRDLAADISRKTGAPLQRVAVNRWYTRHSIPSKYDLAMIESANERSISLSLVDLMKARSVHSDQRGASKPAFQGGAQGSVAQ